MICVVYVSQFLLGVSVVAIDHVSALPLEVEVAHLGLPEGVQELPLHGHLHHIGDVACTLIVECELVGGVLGLLVGEVLGRLRVICMSYVTMLRSSCSP